MMDAVHEPGVNTVVWMTSAQAGKTEGLLNVIGFHMDQDPTSMLVVEPTLQMGEALSKDRLAPMIRDTPVLTGLVREPRSRNSNNTLLHKSYPGGQITICGANSAASLAMRPVRGALFDEVDRFPVSAGTEGDPVKLGQKRTSNFHNRFTVLASTPTTKGASRIEDAFEMSDKRRYYVPCPHCGGLQPLEWAQMRWGKNEDGHGWDGSDPVYVCAECDKPISERDKPKMLRGGRWIAEGVSNGIAGFHISALYSPWVKWREIVAEYYEALGDTEKMRVWTNTVLGETFEETGTRLETNDLYARREVYPAEVPSGALVLVAGVDVQDDRLEVQVTGYGLGEESWRITRRVLWGDPADDLVWNDLDDIILAGRWDREGGGQMAVAASCIDSGGHHTKKVYAYVKTRTARRVFATIGRAGFGRQIVSAPSKKRYGRDRRPVDVFIVGVDEVKRLVHARLRKPEPGPGYCHFPLTDEFGPDYFDQLSAEELRTKKSMGVSTLYWHKVKERNEALDMSVLDYAALILLKPNFEALARRLGAAADRNGSDDDENKGGPQEGPRKTPSKVRRRGGFVNGWK